MSNMPAYDIGTVVYLRESAGIGFLEAVRIDGIVKTNAGWLYSVACGAVSPIAPGLYGDRILHTKGQILYFSESELVTQCDALQLAEANALRVWQQLHQQRISLCPGTVPSTSG